MGLSLRDMAMATESELSSPCSSLLSSPLSSPAASPSPPPEMPPIPAALRAAPYPSPPSSEQTSQSGSPVPDATQSSQNSDREGPPPAKRRRLTREPEERTTEYLDLRSGEVDPDQQDELDRVMRVLHKHKKIVVIAGAGMSVSAGIPDFRSSTGLFKSLKEEHKLKGSGKHLFDASVYRDDTSTSSFHSMVRSMSRLTKDAKPTAFHHMLATIANEGRLMRLYSQNVDGIDTALEPLKTSIPLRKDDDGKWPRTVQLHGGLDKMVCSKCNALSDFEPDLFDGPVPPACPTCVEINDIRTNHQGRRSHGIGCLRPRMVLYNEHNPDDEAIGTVTRDDLRKKPDAVIVVGTTLKVPGVRRIVREMCGIVRDRRGGVSLWINNDLPPVAKDLEECFDIVVQANCDEIANRAAMSKWDDVVNADDFAEVSDEEAQKVSAKGMEVHVSPREFLDKIDLPSKNHYNNSFSPPPHEVSTPTKLVKQRPMMEPFTQHKHSEVLKSIEIEGLRAYVDTETGMSTPTKSRKNTSDITGRQISINDSLKNASKNAGNGKGSKNAKPKNSNVKFVKRAKTKAPKTKSTAMQNASLTFATTKRTAVEQKTELKVKAMASFAAQKSPGTLSDVMNVHASPRKSPSKPPSFPNLLFAKENDLAPKDPVARAVS
ncbi:Hypothetical protein R9X50_00262800 [Acrodontium crateriforme]|uniref:Deacetylase sirtuin-type domain-containing protein n=1 Tax=Acrodontium crateriforme TaxID=150365 RepID=A0AAQ3M2T8_9PEZI|nr:Hypothetical protein R9X50_00262800 [Acrodontium crateriforme]